MRALKNFYLIKADENANKTIKGPNGPLYLDIDFNPNLYTTKVGTVYACPEMCDSEYDLKDGETVLLSHSIVKDDNKIIIDGETLWKAAYYNIFATLKEGILTPMRDFLFVEPIEDTNTHYGKLQIKFDDKKVAKRGIVRYVGSLMEEIGIKPGDEVQFTKFANYSVKVGDKELYRMRLRNLRLVVREGKPLLLPGQVLTDKDEVKYIADDVKNVVVGDKVGFFERVESGVDFNGPLLSMKEENIIYIK